MRSTCVKPHPKTSTLTDTLHLKRFTLRRGSYTAEGQEAHAATCVGGALAGRACTPPQTRGGGDVCAPGGGYCDAYCPDTRHRSPSGAASGEEGGAGVGLTAWTPVSKCWLCPEALHGGLVDPDAAQQDWLALDFCSQCLGPLATSFVTPVTLCR